MIFYIPKSIKTDCMCSTFWPLLIIIAISCKFWNILYALKNWRLAAMQHCSVSNFTEDEINIKLFLQDDLIRTRPEETEKNLWNRKYTTPCIIYFWSKLKVKRNIRRRLVVYPSQESDRRKVHFNSSQIHHHSWWLQGER